ncbi:MAG: hypothetical protein ACKO5K_08805 [Armatimonadota bacterium]
MTAPRTEVLLRSDGAVRVRIDWDTTRGDDTAAVDLPADRVDAVLAAAIPEDPEGNLRRIRGEVAPDGEGRLVVSAVGACALVWWTRADPWRWSDRIRVADDRVDLQRWASLPEVRDVGGRWVRVVLEDASGARHPVEEGVDLGAGHRTLVPVRREHLPLDARCVWRAERDGAHPVRRARVTAPDGAGDAIVVPGEAPPETVPVIDNAWEVRLAPVESVAVEMESRGESGEMHGAQVRSGVLHGIRRRRRETGYRWSNAGSTPLSFELEHPSGNEWNLVSPDDGAQTPDRARSFACVAPAGGDGRLVVVEDRVEPIALDLATADADALGGLAGGDLPEEVRSTVAVVLARRRKVEELERAAEEAEARLPGLQDEEVRIKEKAIALDPDSNAIKVVHAAWENTRQAIRGAREEAEARRREAKQVREELKRYLQEREGRE